MIFFSQKMITAVQYLLGAHDFRNFCKMDIANGVVEFTRNILDVSVHPVCSCDELEHSGWSIQFRKCITYLFYQLSFFRILYLCSYDKR